MSITALVDPLPNPLPSPVECYRHITPMVDATVRRFVRRYGGNYPDLRTDANFSWWRGDTAYRERATNGRSIHADYRVEIRRWVWFELFDDYRVRAQYRRKEKTIIKQDGLSFTRPAAREFNFPEFIDELTDDARTVVGLLFGAEERDAPEPWAAEAMAKGGQPRNVRSTLRSYLTGLGWAAQRINDSFDEIRDALS